MRIMSASMSTATVTENLQEFVQEGLQDGLGRHFVETGFVAPHGYAGFVQDIPGDQR
jgi:hypothetical protein